MLSRIPRYSDRPTDQFHSCTAIKNSVPTHFVNNMLEIQLILIPGPHKLEQAGFQAGPKTSGLAVAPAQPYGPYVYGTLKISGVGYLQSTPYVMYRCQDTNLSVIQATMSRLSPCHDNLIVTTYKIKVHTSCTSIYMLLHFTI